MSDIFKIDHCSLNYDLTGLGNTIIFLHGYLENLSIWDDYSRVLSKDFQVLRIDLPGHGKSTCSMDNISMDYMADCLNSLILHLNIRKCVLVGHSMGGYVSLAYAEKYNDKLSGLCLFHSTPNADSIEKIASRKSDIDLVIQGRSNEIINRNIPNLFANDNQENCKAEIAKAIEIASSTPNKGIIGSLQGMAGRPDRNYVFGNLTCPTMMIFGKKDNLIPMSTAESLAQRHKKTRTIFLDNSGHMGFIEEKDQAQLAITFFLNRVFV